jgi:4-amino-4-deoxy-L-arabinose transferase-like glycosyltransferase
MKTHHTSALPLYKQPGFLLLAGLFLIFAFTALYQLGTAPLSNWDEAFYGENIKQIVKTGDWIVLKFNSFPFTEKPPLYMWIAAVLGKIFGMSEFIIRLPSAICGILTVGLVSWYTYKKFGTIPALAAYITLALNDIFVWRSRDGDLDTMSALLFVLIFILMLSSKKWRYPVLGLLFGLLYLTKLAVVAIPLLIFGLHELVFMRHEIRKNLLEYVKLVVCAAVLPAIWVGAAYLRLGNEAIVTYLLRSDAGALELSFKNLSKDYIMYAYYSLQRRLFPLLVIGLGIVAWNIKKRWNFTLFLFSTVLFAQLLFFERKNNWYLVPLFPFWSISIAYGVKVVMDFAKKYKYWKFGVALFVLGICVIGLKTYKSNLMPMFTTFGTTREAQTAKKAGELSKEGDIVVRLDHQYPTAVYYTNRRVLSSPGNYDGGGGLNGKDHFISRINVVNGIKSGRLHWVMGTQYELNDLIRTYHVNPKQIIKTNDEEAVAQF